MEQSNDLLKSIPILDSLKCFESNFFRIMKVDLTKDSFELLKSDLKMAEESKRFSVWIRNFAEDGNVHPDDMDSYFAYTNHYYLREYFLRFAKPWRLRYRRRTSQGYGWVMMEMKRAEEYTAQHQVVMLYVQSVEDEFNTLVKQNTVTDDKARWFASAVSSLFPLGLVVNLSQNKYKMMRSREFRSSKAPEEGNLEDLLAIGEDSVPTPEGKREFQQKLGRQAQLAAFFRGEQQIQLRHQQIADDGTIHWVETKVIFVDGPDEDVRAVCVANYIDDEIAATERLKQAQRDAERANRAKEAFLFNMSHDIRTPLNAILGLAELTERHVDQKEQVLHYMAELKDSGQMLLNILKNILEYARIASDGAEVEEEPCNLMETLESLGPLAADLMEKKRLVFTKEFDIPQPKVLCDRSKLKTIVLNLLANAINYTQQGGNIKLQVRQYPAADKQSRLLEICLSDDGIGMTASFQKHVFEPFTRAATSTVSGVQGTGLGLSLVKSLVDVMGGTIKLESRPAEGTKITVSLPQKIVQEGKMQLQQAAKLNMEMLRGKRLLLAEDNDINAEITISLLNEAGVTVDRALDGVECVAMLKKAPADYYQLVLMDIQMPNLDGLGAAELIRSMDLPCSKLPIVALTANAFAQDREKSLRAGMNAHLSKPIEVRELYTVLLQYLS